MSHSFDDEAGFDEVQPKCDICGQPQWREGDDWNGETGNHRSCETPSGLGYQEGVGLTECEACLAIERGADEGLVQSTIDTYAEEQGFLCDEHAPGYKEDA